jgi:hypothetical protein
MTPENMPLLILILCKLLQHYILIKVIQIPVQKVSAPVTRRGQATFHNPFFFFWNDGHLFSLLRNVAQSTITTIMWAQEILNHFVKFVLVADMNIVFSSLDYEQPENKRT